MLLEGHDLIPWQIPIIDPASSIVPLSFTFEIENEFGRQTGKHGMPCYRGDHIYLTFKVGIPSWVSVIWVDPKGVYGLFQETYDPSWVIANDIYSMDKKLNDTVGTETFYFIASPKPFNYKKHIAPHLTRTAALSENKGPEQSSYDLKLPKVFTVKTIQCMHLRKAE